VGFLNRPRRDAAYGPPPESAAGQDARDVIASASEPLGDTPDEKATEVVVPPRVDPTRMRPMLPSFGQRALTQRMTAAERAFMDIRRGSSD